MGTNHKRTTAANRNISVATVEFETPTRAGEKRPGHGSPADFLDDRPKGSNGSIAEGKT